MKRVIFGIEATGVRTELEVSDALHELIRSALLNANPSAFEEYLNNDDRDVYLVDGFTVELLD